GRAGQVGHRVHAPEDAVLLPMPGRPQLAQPPLLVFSQWQYPPHVRALQVQIGALLERLDDRLRDILKIRTLVGESAARAETDVDHFLAFVAIVPSRS